MEVSGSLNNFLEQFITEERKKRIDEVLNHRTRYITVALEDIYQSHNISAVMRSCDCFGINDIHLIENKNEFVFHKDIELGSTNWLNIFRHKKKQNNTLDTIRLLKEKGYRIIATSPHAECSSPENFNVEKGPAAIFFGTELTGLSEVVFDHCDEYLKIPLYGFTESLNISVSAAIIMSIVYQKLIKSDVNWQLNDEEKTEIKFKWLKHSVKKSDMLINKFLDNHKF